MKQLLICSFILLIFLNSCKETEVLSYNHPFLIEANARPLVIAHRGGTKFFPENTMLAFEYSDQVGADVLEIDVQITSDGQLVICHDITINRTSDGIGNIHLMTYNELVNYNFGYQFNGPNNDYPYQNDPVKIPLMEEVFQRFPAKNMIIEIKSEGRYGKQAADELLRLVELYSMQEYVAVFSFDKHIMDYFYTQNEVNTYTGASMYETLDFVVQAIRGNTDGITNRYQIFAMPLELEGIPLSTDDATFLKIAHQKGISVCYWTINNEEEMRTLVTLGADGVITDRPELLIEVLEDMGF